MFYQFPVRLMNAQSTVTLTPKEAAKHLKIHVLTVYDLLKRGELPGRKVGGSWRIPQDALHEYLHTPELEIADIA